MGKQSFLTWVQAKNIKEAYNLDYWLSFPLEGSGIQGIQTKIWMISENSFKLQVSLDGLVDEWLKKGKVEKKKTLSISFDDYIKIRSMIHELEFWEEISFGESDVIGLDGSTTEIQGWWSKENRDLYKRISVWSPPVKHPMAHIRDKIIELTPEELLPCSKSTFMKSIY